MTSSPPGLPRPGLTTLTPDQPPLPPLCAEAWHEGELPVLRHLPLPKKLLLLLLPILRPF